MCKLNLASLAAVLSGLAIVSASVHANASNYLVVSLVPKNDPYEKAGAKLVSLRTARGTRSSAADLESLLPKLREYQPEHVAFVTRPEQIDVNLARNLFRLATRVDDDPFVDFSYGMITGPTPEDAIGLAEAGRQAESERQKPELGILGVADGGVLNKSLSQSQAIPLTGLTLPVTWSTIASRNGNGDPAFVEQTLRQLESKPLFALAGHGFPDGIVGGPNHRDLQGRDFSGAIVYNIACYTGVTSNWFQTDFQSSRIKQNRIATSESFCLNMLQTGVAGYVAYTCPRPAGPEMFADVLSLATEGISIGEQRRRHANSVILTHLSQNELSTTGFESLEDGQSIKVRRATDEIVRGMSTGSVLFGDPATVPFRQTRGAYPIKSRVTKKGNKLIVDVSIDGPLWHWFCSDQLEQSNMKVEARIPMAPARIKSVRVDKLPFGDGRPTKKTTAAVETHRGNTFLHVKATFDRPDQAELTQHMQGVSARFSVELDSESGADQFLHVAGAQ